ncbi:hypothetical protein [Streptomyces fradiae]|uniref:hypothetical protein n=1 Tax=Streptomyces fradiae TaxID=1906 RepID=UPI002942FBE3|nr:hypothetical protein [Streptomyces fradiae]WOI58593.1 hypothetical protein RYQ63_00835 [Streptomyces fradiae]
MRYLVRYAIIPAGVGPDDYEPADLSRHTEEYDLPSEPGGTYPDGRPLVYGPPIPVVEDAIRARHGLSRDTNPLVLDLNALPAG